MFEVVTIIGPLLHYLTIACTVCIGSVSAGIGEALISIASLQASDRQPYAHGSIIRAAILGMAVVETTAILGIFVAILLLQSQATLNSWYANLANIGIIAAMGIPGLVLGIVSARPAQASCASIARQPTTSKQITAFMIMTQALIQTPLIAGLVITLLIYQQAPYVTDLGNCLRLIASGLCVGFGSIGPALALSDFARAACTGIGINRIAHKPLLPFTLLSGAMIETPMIFAMAVSLLLLFHSSPTVLGGFICLAAGLCAGIGTLFPSISSGNTATTACTIISRNIALYADLSKTSFFIQGIIDTCAIYTIVIAFLLIIAS